MTAKVLIKRTATPNLPPAALDLGELSVEMAAPIRLWVGTPTGNKKLVDLSAINSVQVYVGDTPPSSPVPGQLWWESDSGMLLLRYDDGSSQQWVACAVQGAKGIDGINGTNGVDGVSGALLTAVNAVTSAVVTINSAIWNTGVVTEGIEILSVPITVKSATSKLRLKGGATCFAASTLNAGLFLYTSLASAHVGVSRSTMDNTSVNFTVGSRLVTHGQPAGTVITCSMRGSRNVTSPSVFVNGTAAGTPYTPTGIAWLDAEEVV